MITSSASILDRIAQRAAAEPSRVAVCAYDGSEDGRAVSYGELERRTRAIASWLSGRTGQGDRVLLTIRDPALFVAALMACGRAGVIAVPLFAASSKRRAALQNAVARDCEPATLLHDGEDQPPDVPQGDARALVADENGRWLETADAQSVFYLQYTSGSTGRPKGVMISHGNIRANVAAIQATFAFDESSTAVNWMPHYHDFGLVFGLLAPLAEGARVVVLDPSQVGRRPRLWLEAISAARATHSGAPDFVYQTCCRSEGDGARPLDLSSWRYAVVGAEPVRASTLERFARTFAPRGFSPEAFFPCFGLAESTLMASGDRSGLPERRTRVVESLGTNAVVGCGRAARGALLRFARADGRLDETGPGEIVVGGPSVSSGYWRDTDATAASFFRSDGVSFVRTGDIGCLDGGELFVIGREKDVLIRSGEKHFSEDVEATVAAADPLLADARLAVFGVEEHDEEVAVVAIEGAAEQAAERERLEGALRRAVLEAHELPIARIVWLRRNQLPKTTSGKVQRGEARRAVLTGTHARRASRTPDRAPNERAADRDPWAAPLLALIVDLVREVQPSASELSPGRTVAEIGVDSVSATLMASRVAELFGVSVNIATLLGDVTLDDVADQLAATLRQRLPRADHEKVSEMLESLRGRGLFD
ncbi:AMP-binding protein [Salinarimonas sp.]|uniref:AMP-binding protein n=1 Tax=Salinarimonas sp. TaxID=2766526 RepID=UPI0032D96E59